MISSQMRKDLQKNNDHLVEKFNSYSSKISAYEKSNNPEVIALDHLNPIDSPDIERCESPKDAWKMIGRSESASSTHTPTIPQTTTFYYDRQYLSHVNREQSVTKKARTSYSDRKRLIGNFLTNEEVSTDSETEITAPIEHRYSHPNLSIRRREQSAISTYGKKKKRTPRNGKHHGRRFRTSSTISSTPGSSAASDIDCNRSLPASFRTKADIVHGNRKTAVVSNDGDQGRSRGIWQTLFGNPEVKTSTTIIYRPPTTTWDSSSEHSVSSSRNYNADEKSRSPKRRRNIWRTLFSCFTRYSWA